MFFLSSASFRKCVPLKYFLSGQKNNHFEQSVLKDESRMNENVSFELVKQVLSSISVGLAQLVLTCIPLLIFKDSLISSMINRYPFQGLRELHQSSSFSFFQTGGRQTHQSKKPKIRFIFKARFIFKKPTLATNTK